VLRGNPEGNRFLDKLFPEQGRHTAMPGVARRPAKEDNPSLALRAGVPAGTGLGNTDRGYLTGKRVS
jgi:hypothetical protein